MSAVQSHVSFILDDLAKKAVAEIITLFDNTFAAFIEELCKKQNEIDQLKKKLESPSDDVNTAGNIVPDKLSALSFEEFSASLQTSNEEDLEQKFPVTQWYFPDEQEYEFEGIDDSQAPLLSDEEVDDASGSESGRGELGALELELKAAEMDRLTEEVQSGTLLSSHSPSPDVNHYGNTSITFPVKKKVGRPRKIHVEKKKVGRPRKVPQITVAETSETTTEETKEAERSPALEHKKRRKVRKVTNTMTCSECRQVFYRPKDFIKHRFSHKQKQLLSCEWCGITFPFRSQMVNHVRIHTGEKPFSCDECDKAFISKGQLRTHMWYHKPKDKNESCSLCGTDSTEPVDGFRPRRRSTRPCTKCGKVKSVT